jgi:hypothetical protein
MSWRPKSGAYQGRPTALIAWLLIDERLKPIVLIGLAASTIDVVLVWWKPRAT